MDTSPGSAKYTSHSKKKQKEKKTLETAKRKDLKKIARKGVERQRNDNKQ